MRLMYCGADAPFGKGLVAHLEREGHTLDWLPESQAPVWLAHTGAYRGLLLDIGTGSSAHLEVMRKASARQADLLVLLFTDASTAALRTQLFDAGADDVIDKPADGAEVAARLHRLLRRRAPAPAPAPTELRVGPLRVDAHSRRVHWHERPVALSNKEFRLLQLFLHSRGGVVCRSDLELTLYGDEREIVSNALEVHIHNLRRKLSRNAIQAVRGVGYRFGPGVCDV